MHKGLLLTALVTLLTLMPTHSFASPALSNSPEAIQIQHQPWQQAFARSTEVPLIAFSAEAEALRETTILGLPLNMGPIDRILRGVVALGLIGTGIYGLSTQQINAPLSWTLIGVAAIPTATAATGFCPLYPLFGVEYSF